jgi:hypothetical protein
MGGRDRRGIRRTAVILGLTLLAAYAYFYQAGGWNQNSRFALVRAILDHQTLRIDAYQDQTGDRAVWEGHYYSDKAPGASLLALAPVAAARAAGRLVGVRPTSAKGIVWGSYVATVATAGLFTVIAALGVYFLALQWGASRRAAVFAAGAYGLSTPAWAYATVFVGHTVSSGCLVVAFTAAALLPTATNHRVARAWVVGLFCGLAVLTEFPAAVPVGLIVLMTAVALMRSGGPGQPPPRDAMRLLAHVVIAGAVVAAVLMAYHWIAFGSPFQLGYGSEDNSEGARMAEHGIFGIGHPTWHVAYEVLLGAYRGLLPLAPLMAVAPIGLALLARRSDVRLPVMTAAAVAAFYLLLNISYTYWEGGWFVGPRHLVPGLPFAALGLAPLWDRGRAAGRALLAAGWLWGAAAGLIVVATTPQPPSAIMAPMQELLWPAFREGDLSINHQRFVDFGADADRLRHNPDAHAAWNLGQLMGLPGLLSLVPLIVILVVAGLVLL